MSNEELFEKLENFIEAVFYYQSNKNYVEHKKLGVGLIESFKETFCASMLGDYIRKIQEETRTEMKNKFKDILNDYYYDNVGWIVASRIAKEIEEKLEKI